MAGYGYDYSKPYGVYGGGQSGGTAGGSYLPTIEPPRYTREPQQQQAPQVVQYPVFIPTPQQRAQEEQPPQQIGRGKPSAGQQVLGAAGTAATLYQAAQTAGLVGGATTGGTAAAGAAASGAAAGSAAAGGAASGGAAGAGAAGGSTLMAAAPYLAIAIAAYGAYSKYREAKKNAGGGDLTTQESYDVANFYRTDNNKWNDAAKWALRATGPFGQLLTNKGVVNRVAKDLGIASTKPGDQVHRDRFRTSLKKTGIIDDQYQMTLADGTKVDFGLDGGSKWKGKDGKDLFRYQWDQSDPLAKQALTDLNAVSWILGGGDERRSVDIAGMLTNTMTAYGETLDSKVVKQRTLGFIKQLKMGKQDALAMLDVLKKQKRIDEQKYQIFKLDIENVYAQLPQEYQGSITEQEQGQQVQQPQQARVRTPEERAADERRRAQQRVEAAIEREKRKKEVQKVIEEDRNKTRAEMANSPLVREPKAAVSAAPVDPAVERYRAEVEKRKRRV